MPKGDKALGTAKGLLASTKYTTGQQGPRLLCTSDGYDKESNVLAVC